MELRWMNSSKDGAERFPGPLPLTCKVLIDNLENLWRFDVAKLCLERLVERFPQQARFRDYLGHATAKLGDMEAALGHASQAVKMAPDNPFSGATWVCST